MSEKQKRFKFLTNNFTLPAFTIAQIYKSRWQVELFFKWIKQHLRIKAFYGTSENAVKTQIWIAVSIYVLVAIVRKRLDWKQASTKFYRFSASRFSRKRPFYRPFSHRTPSKLLSDPQPTDSVRLLAGQQ